MSPNFTRFEVIEAAVDAVDDGADLEGMAQEKPVGRTLYEADGMNARGMSRHRSAGGDSFNGPSEGLAALPGDEAYRHPTPSIFFNFDQLAWGTYRNRYNHHCDIGCMDTDQERLDRRDFVKAAIAIGGSSALTACMDLEERVSGYDTPAQSHDEPHFPRGTDDPGALPRQQHAWNEYLVNSSHGTFGLPQHQVILGLRYTGPVPPTKDAQTQVEDALQTLERAYQWGTRGNSESIGINNGLLFTLGYAQKYFDRSAVTVDGLVPPETVLKEIGESPSKADGFDALLLLTADFGSILLGAEEALFGDRENLNGLKVDADLRGLFEIVERRTGVVGKGMPAETLDNDDIPDDAPLSMGFRSAFADALPAEDRMTITDGPFEGGTMQLVSRLNTDLDGWYDQSHKDRVKEMFCPAHSENEVGETGERLGKESGITRTDVENIEEHAEEYEIVGHSAKTARARNEDFEQIILRRSEGVATDEAGGSAFNFSSIQRSIQDFITVRKTMNIDEYDVDVSEERHGIVGYLETISRGTFVLPPREKRALPNPA